MGLVNLDPDDVAYGLIGSSARECNEETLEKAGNPEGLSWRDDNDCFLASPEECWEGEGRCELDF